MRIYLTGADGMLGTALTAALGADPATAHWAVKGVSVRDFDIADESAARASILGFAPDVVVHTAAHAIVDDCERDPSMALRVNIQGTHHVADACREAGSQLVHISSDYVFDGATPPRGGYREDAVPNPLSVYGLTKLAGERIAQSVPEHLCVRTSWLFGGADERTDQVRSLVGALLRRERPALIHDQFSCPTYTADLAGALVRLLSGPLPPSGALHMANSGSASWQEVGLVAAAELRRAGLPDIPDPVPLSMEDCGFVGGRPRDSSLATGRLAGLGSPLPHWSDAVRRYCAALLAEGSVAVGSPAAR
ncbi:NAD(P)-dependent oxidoreductase [Streptomyces antimycoticus]|uniref:dTDP-4-dehydrorhamnose reductase n=1 Tax=Streptomyces antimycoticus TaxID=68175 RepID=A0A499UA55_9ACTN|nr:dTDP-4-dehydrorhamnose reductase [Streptomyces antimycoticus]BBJ37323.1 NAD(P)-dependent oxidoreductase [Streptomyces antimycoticus]